MHLQEAEAALELKKFEELGKAELALAIASEKASQIEKMAEADLNVWYLLKYLLLYVKSRGTYRLLSIDYNCSYTCYQRSNMAYSLNQLKVAHEFSSSTFNKTS